MVKQLAEKLTAEFGNGWSERHLRHCTRFATVFPDSQIVSALWRQLSWTHIKSLVYIDDSLKRDFYIEMCKIEKWSSRTLADRIDSLLYERTAISKKPDQTIDNDDYYMDLLFYHRRLKCLVVILSHDTTGKRRFGKKVAPVHTTYQKQVAATSTRPRMNRKNRKNRAEYSD